MIDIRNKKYIVFHDKLFEVIGWAEGPTVTIQPVRSDDYEKCECGRPLPNQQHEYVLSAPILQNNIGGVYELAKKE